MGCVASTIRTIATAIADVVLCRPGSTYRPEIIRPLPSQKRDCRDNACGKRTGNDPQHCCSLHKDKASHFNRRPVEPNGTRDRKLTFGDVSSGGA